MIGLFDSGSGGLTVLKQLQKLAPNADVLYFGDIQNAPYGIKNPKELKKLAYQGIELLKSRGANEIIAACNSVSKSVLSSSMGNFPMIEMSIPTSKILKKYEGKKALLIATSATIESGLYEKALSKKILLDSLPIPNLAGAIEFGTSKILIDNMIEIAFRSRSENKYDVLILGCTHFPLVLDTIKRISRKYFGNIDIIDPAEAVAQEAVVLFNTQGNARIRVLLSEDSIFFRKNVDKLFLKHSKFEIEIF